MKKTFLTHRKKEELLMEIAKLRENYADLIYDKTIFPIRLVSQDKIRVSNGRINTYWRLKLDVDGEITVERCSTISEKAELLTLVIIDIISAYLIFYNRLSFNGVLILLGILICECLPLYYLYLIDPMKKIEHFIYKYLNK